MNKTKGKTKPKTEPKTEPEPAEKVEPITCPECSETFPDKPSFRGHMLSDHIKLSKKEPQTDTVLKVLTELGGILEKEELMKLCQGRNPSKSVLEYKAFMDPINVLAKQGKVTVETLVKLVEE